ncbi:substrate-binding domain-containing protein [Enterococcus sp. AZ196]|uniref:substrate-binding domain-containing protein n=1 Tax=Enterococcus sp. AZ196 TaxID=2774659 RepID=UPI003D26CD05
MKFIKKMIVFSLILLFATGCSSDSAANKDALEKTDGKDEIVLDENDIKSTGPNGEKAAPASALTLTDEEIAKLKAGNYSAAISFHYAGNDWSSAQQKGLEDTFKKLGINIVGTTDANFSVEQQVSDLETLTALNPDVMISIPTDAKATSDAFKRVSSRGIKLVFMDNVPDNFVAGENYVGAVSADNYGNGVIAAELIGDKLKGKGKIGIVNYDVDYFVTNQRLEAFEKTIKKKYPDIEVIAKSGFSDVNQSTEVADAMLTQNPDIEAIFAIWDIPAEGVLSALTSAGREDIFVSTIDLGDNIAKEIAQGKVLGVGAQLPYDQGVAEATMAAYALLGKETPSYVAVPATKVERNTIVSGYEMVYHKKAPGFITEELDK